LNKNSSKAKLLIVGAAALAVAIPALGQDRPESLLPPGFGEPAPPTTAPSSSPPGSAPSQPGTTPDAPRDSEPNRSGENSATSRDKGGNPTAAAQTDDEKPVSPLDELDEDELAALRMTFDVPPAQRRSLSQVGIISAANGGFPSDAFGTADGNALQAVLKVTHGPLASRWGSIMMRRLLSSRTNKPENVNGADWVAERAWLLLRMGESVAARQLVQQVDAGNYSDRLYKVAMQSFLANADLAGMCPLAPTAFDKVDDPTWKMARPICASLAGEQGAASGFLNQASKKRWTVGVDYLLAEKAVGAGTNGRRSVKIEWNKVTGFNAWRFGLAHATGVMPPKNLMASAGRHVNGWLVQLPMIDVNLRASAAPAAAKLGVLSNKAMVSIFSNALDNPDSNSQTKQLAEQLSIAYAGADDNARIAAMQGLWKSESEGLHSMLVLTARAAALVTPSSANGANSDMLIASMMTAGLDTQAVGWADIIDSGSLGWGLLAVGAPSLDGRISYSQLDDFYDNDQSLEVHKSAFLIAALAGLDRVDPQGQADFIEKLEIAPMAQSSWSRAITSAAERGESGTVALLAAAGMQAGDWTKIPAHHLYYITRSLRIVGLEADARMIAAEAVTFG
jgi:hypothetical protein